MKKPHIYFAGKISDDDWRKEILGGFNRVYHEEKNLMEWLFNPDFSADHGTFINCGPFFVAACHFCDFREPTGHGIAGGASISDKLAKFNRAELRRKIFQVNHDRLKRADFVLAYINETDCYGTLGEIGMAQALGKRLVVGFGPNAEVEEMWTVRERAEKVYRGSPLNVWRSFKADILIEFIAGVHK